MDELEKRQLVKRYATLKQKRAEMDEELSKIRGQIIEYCEQEQLSDFETGRYRVKLVHQERKEFDDQKLYEALPDPDVWRLISKADPSKISGMLKLNVITENVLNGTFTPKRITLLQVDKK